MAALAPQPRRQFVRMVMTLATVSVWGGKRWSGSLLANVQPSTPVEGGLLRLRLSDFPALREDGGAVRVGTSPIGPNHRPDGLFYPVIVIRVGPGKFSALDAACTHEGCTVPPLEPGADFMQCPCHGSQYRLDGTVRRGPANFPLRTFPVVFDGVETLLVQMPDVSFSLEAYRGQAGHGRIRLEFVAFETLDYVVYFRPERSPAWSGPVKFALSADGPADQTQLRGAADFASIYVDASAQSGIYGVAMSTQPV